MPCMSGGKLFIPHAVKDGTFHRNPKRKRGNNLVPRLRFGLRVTVNRVRDIGRVNRVLRRNGEKTGQAGKHRLRVFYPQDGEKIDTS
jgi:hypothetical protein